MRPARGLALAAFAFVAGLGSPVPALARPPTRLLAIGTNTPPAEWGTNLPTLGFADDDALSMVELGEELGWKTWLLTVADRDSQRRHEAAVHAARPPTVAELSRALDEVARSLAEARDRGEPADLVLFISGHGRRGGLALLDGEITERVLGEQILARMPARFVHLFVDACHAETVVHARGEDREATIEPVDEGAASRWLEGRGLSRYPQVGALIATARDAETHEWDLFGHGVFTHQLLSGLRGAADVNGDRRIEYSELAAFISAANREVADARARLEVLSRPPELDVRAPIVDLVGASSLSWLTGASAGLGHFHVEDRSGTRLADAHAEPGHAIDLVVPAGELRLVAARGEATIDVPPRERVAVGSLTFEPASTRARGGLADAFARGLFVAAYGPLYYRGYADQTHAVSVRFEAADAEPSTASWPKWVAFGAAGALATGGAVTGALALSARADWNDTPYQREAEEARGRYDGLRYASFALLGGAVVSLAIGAWLASE